MPHAVLGCTDRTTHTSTNATSCLIGSLRMLYFSDKSCTSFSGLNGVCIGMIAEKGHRVNRVHMGLLVRVQVPVTPNHPLSPWPQHFKFLCLVPEPQRSRASLCSYEREQDRCRANTQSLSFSLSHAHSHTALLSGLSPAIPAPRCPGQKGTVQAYAYIIFS